MTSQIALLGADDRSKQDLLCALAPRLQGTPWVARAVDHGSQLLPRPALVLLLASTEAHTEPDELLWRERLAREGLPFSVLHGDAQPRLDGAWRLIEPLLGIAPALDARAGATSKWSWSCEKCSDPACEHRLFQDLLQGRSKG